MYLTNPFIELGKKQGAKIGRHEAQIDIVIDQLCRRFGDLSPFQYASVKMLNPARIGRLAASLLDFRSIEDLDGWLKKKPAAGCTSTIRSEKNFIRPSPEVSPPAQGKDLNLPSRLLDRESKETLEKAQKMFADWKEEGAWMGYEKAYDKGKHALLLRQLERRLGALPLSRKKSIRRLGPVKTEALSLALLEFRSRTDLALWLRNNKID